jgi:hypothetical protein
VDALLTSLIGVAATLLGSFTTYLFQSRAVERGQVFERDEQHRREQADACAAFAAALTELKRGLITLWFRRRENPDGATAVGAISGTSGTTELRAAEDEFEAAVKAFISTASARLRAMSLR